MTSRDALPSWNSLELTLQALTSVKGWDWGGIGEQFIKLVTMMVTRFSFSLKSVTPISIPVSKVLGWTHISTLRSKILTFTDRSWRGGSVPYSVPRTHSCQLTAICN